MSTEKLDFNETMAALVAMIGEPVGVLISTAADPLGTVAHIEGGLGGATPANSVGVGQCSPDALAFVVGQRGEGDAWFMLGTFILDPKTFRRTDRVEGQLHIWTDHVVTKVSVMPRDEA